MVTLKCQQNLAARSFLFILLSGVVLLAVSWRDQGNRLTPVKTIEIHARMAENGGWYPGDITIQVGEPLRLRLVSDDVVHSFAIGQSDLSPIELIPGKMVETTVSFDRPGKYTYYCTRWCGVNHWRMRGVIEVLPSKDATVGSPSQPTTTAPPPLYIALGLDIDAPHPADVVPVQKPSAVEGARLSAKVPEGFTEQYYLRTHTPVQVWQALRSENSLKGLDDQQIWDLVASLWLTNTTPGNITQGKNIFAQNCAACHGENGAGDGVMAKALGDSIGFGENQGEKDHHDRQSPANFTDAERMLGASGAILHGKIVRGGMGTGMPYWGPILTDEQIWTVVDYLWSFVLNLERK